MLVYNNVMVETIGILRISALVFYSFEFIINMSTVKKAEGKIMTNLQNIWKSIGSDKILMDLVNILLLILDLSVDWKGMVLLRMWIIVKVPRVLKSLE